MKVVTILGGGSVWTPCLLQELESCGALGELTVRLYGRDPSHSQDVERFATSSGNGGHDVEVVHSLEKAVDGADLILNQVRIGGLEGRAEDEAICRRLGLVADDSLGLGGLRAAVRANPFIREAGRAIQAGAPDAWLINLANPTDVLGRMWKAAGVRRVVSACEYAQKFVRETAKAVGQVRPHEWGYIGMSHVGWAIPPEGTTRLRLENAFPEFQAWIREFEAVPTPWRVAGHDDGRGAFQAQTQVHSRAHALLELTAKIRKAMRTGDHGLHARLLHLRDPEWYREVIAPLITGLLLGRTDERIVGSANETQLASMRDDVFLERWMRIGIGGVEGLPLRCSSACLRDIEAIATLREMAFDLVRSPSGTRLRRYLESDPLTRALGKNEMQMELLGV